jgi:hypothetical protein
MLGRFLELSVAAHPIVAVLEFCQRLGFRPAPSRDVLPTPYAAVCGGGVALGLHDREIQGATATFVRPDLRTYMRAIRRLGVSFEFADLAEDRFHQAAFLDPNGQMITLVEARTFSPAVSESADVFVCGEFLEYSVATHSRKESEAFWTALGFGVIAEGETPYPWVRLGGCGVAIGFHETARFPSGVSFHSPNLLARIQYLKAKGLEPREGSPIGSAGGRSATLGIPEGVPLYLLEANA